MWVPMYKTHIEIHRIVSGGQTGADRAGLDWAIRAQIPHGGWCPQGRRAEDGSIPPHYRLTETPKRDYAQRTAWNVRDSDGTAIFSCSGSLSGGSALTQSIAQDLGRPVLHVHTGLGLENAGIRLQDFVQQHAIQILNIAGPRQSHEPDVVGFVEMALSLAFVDCTKVPPSIRLSAYLRLGRLASAEHLMQVAHAVPETQDLDAIQENLKCQAATEQALGNRRQSTRIQRRILALKVFREHGLDQERLIQPVDLPEGYAGKILLLSLKGPGSEGTTCLRSGDLWHREILADTEEEIADLGFDLTDVSPVGGAWVRFDESQVITLYGSSQEFGECDKQCAAQLIAGVYPHHRVQIKA